jgi:hypothetical protein
MATFNSWRERAIIGTLTVIFILTSGNIFADNAQNSIFIARAEAEFHRAQKQFELSDTSTNAIQFTRTCFDFANLATNNETRADVARDGIDACRRVIARETNSVAAHYYLGMNLGELARTEFLGALRIVREMEREFTKASDLDEHFDFAGPARCLGLLYRDAPGWPASIGSKHKAKTYLETAARLAPGYPENILNLAESELKWRDADAAQKEADALDALWPQAQKEFTGDDWAHDWADWSARREALHQQLSSLKKSH